MTTPYRPISWNDQSLSVPKLQQMANNDQWLFENTPRMRYSVDGNVRDSGLKIIAGKVGYGRSGNDWTDFNVYFGSFFSAACKPVVVATVEIGGNGKRKLANIEGFGGTIDYRGFHGFVTTQENPNLGTFPVDHPSYVHWIAIGY